MALNASKKTIILGETFSVKVLNQKPKLISHPVTCEIINPTGSVYGDYRNKISITADDIELLD